MRQMDDSKPSGRTLFVINLPFYVTEQSLKRAFSVSGKVKSVVCQENSDGFKVAYVVYNKREALLKALKLQRLGPLSTDATPVITGMKKWIEIYNSGVHNQTDLYQTVESFIKNYDKEAEAQKTNEKQVDDEGWTVVSRKGRNPGIARKESVDNKLKMKNKMKSRRKELKNFYTFQLKEEKMKSIVALRKSFQESKEKVNLMKTMRNFKPY